MWNVECSMLNVKDGSRRDADRFSPTDAGRFSIQHSTFNIEHSTFAFLDPATYGTAISTLCSPELSPTCTGSRGGGATSVCGPRNPQISYDPAGRSAIRSAPGSARDIFNRPTTNPGSHSPFQR